MAEAKREQRQNPKTKNSARNTNRLLSPQLLNANPLSQGKETSFTNVRAAKSAFIGLKVYKRSAFKSETAERPLFRVRPNDTPLNTLSTTARMVLEKYKRLGEGDIPVVLQEKSESFGSVMGFNSIGIGTMSDEYVHPRCSKRCQNQHATYRHQWR